MDEKEKAAQTIDDDLNTTVPNVSSEWQMPEPVFQQTSGKLPEGFERNYAAPVMTAAETSPQVDPPATDVDHGNIPNSYVAPEPKNPALKIVLVLLGLAAMIAFIVVFLTVVYFFFLKSD